MELLNFDEMEPMPESLADKLKIDELIMIFENDWISTNDLLNFRLVNKTWRDSATTMLLNRDACLVDLKQINTRVYLDDENQSWFFKFNDRNHKTNNTLRELTNLMSNSSKFPVVSFSIRTHSSPRVFADYSNFEDLKLFFKLHGTKIKSLSHDGPVTEKLVRDICCNYAPQLEFLNLSQAVAIKTLSNQDVDGDEENVFPFKSLIIGNCATNITEEYKHLIHFLLSCPSRLSCIAEVPLHTVSYILNEDKGNLIRSVDFRNITTEETHFAFAPLMEQFLGMRPKLSKVSLDVSNFPWEEMNLASVNKLINSCQNTLRELRLYFCRSEGVGNLKIPPMKHLTKLTLRRRLLNVLDADEPLNLFAFHHGILGRDYFPSLKNVMLQSRSIKIETLVSFFLLGLSQNIFPNVDVLEIFTMPISFKVNLATFQNVFPHVRILTLNWDKNIKNLSGSLWRLRTLEFIELYEICANGETGAEFEVVDFVDSFFTGFSISLCKKLKTKILPRHFNIPGKWKFLQREESIRNLQNLKQLKLKFSPNFSVPFASRVSGLYAFGQMPATKFIVSYDPEKINKIIISGFLFISDQDESNDDKRNKFEKLCFGDIQSYVKIIREEYPF